MIALLDEACFLVGTVTDKVRGSDAWGQGLGLGLGVWLRLGVGLALVGDVVKARSRTSPGWGCG